MKNKSVINRIKRSLKKRLIKKSGSKSKKKIKNSHKKKQFILATNFMSKKNKDKDFTSSEKNVRSKKNKNIIRSNDIKIQELLTSKLLKQVDDLEKKIQKLIKKSKKKKIKNKYIILSEKRNKESDENHEDEDDLSFSKKKEDKKQQNDDNDRQDER